jgi:hypothetical protein
VPRGHQWRRRRRRVEKKKFSGDLLFESFPVPNILHIPLWPLPLCCFPLLCGHDYAQLDDVVEEDHAEEEGDSHAVTVTVGAAAVHYVFLSFRTLGQLWSTPVALVPLATAELLEHVTAH